MLCAIEPLKLKVPVFALNVPEVKEKLPPTSVVLLFEFQVPPLITILVGESVLPVLLVHTPPGLVISMSPPMETLVPETWIVPCATETLLPATVAVLEVKVTLGLVPSNVTPVPPPTWIAPPWLPAELEENEVVSTV